MQSYVIIYYDILANQTIEILKLVKEKSGEINHKPMNFNKFVAKEIKI